MYIVDDTRGTQSKHLRHTYETQSTYSVTTLHEIMDKKKEKRSPPFSKMTPTHVARLKEKPGVVTCSKEGKGVKRVCQIDSRF